MARAAFVVPLVLLLVRPAESGPLRVGVSVSWRTGERSAFSGLLRLEVPLDRIAAPRLPPALAEPPPEGAPKPGRAPARVPRFEPAFARELVRQAFRVRGAPRALERLESLAGRARAAALLPDLMVRAARSTDQTLRLQPSGVDRYELTQTGGADLLFEARATWRLDRLVFASEELRIEQLRREQLEGAERLALVVLKHLFTWQRARSRLAAAELDDDERLALELDVLEAESALDVLTGGFFTRRLARSGHFVKTE